MRSEALPPFGRHRLGEPVRNVVLAAGVLLTLSGVFLPTGWYDRLPRNPTLPEPPISGITLLQFCVVTDGLLLLWLALRSRSFDLPAEADHIAVPARRDVREVVSRRTALVLLGAITLAGLALRLWRLDSDLWLDEISPLLLYGHLSPVEVMASYLGSGNHFLNTILVRLSTAAFGEHAWSVRLPAAVFGAATIPVWYWTARLAFTRVKSLATALLLAVSYHHIFFSQNARGYTAYMFFSLLSTTLFCRALGDRRLRTWALYSAAMSLNFASLLLSAFVFASHVVVGLAALLIAYRAGYTVRGVAKQLLLAFAATGFLSFQLYAMVLPQAYVYMRSVYTQAATGYALLSGEFVHEVLRGMLVGFGARLGWTAVPVLLLALAFGALGYVRVFARHWLLTSSLTLPCILTGLAVVMGGLTVSPRFFLLALPLSILTLVEGLDALVRGEWRSLPSDRRVERAPWRPLAPTALIAGLLVLPVLDYYKTPKQGYIASADYLRRERAPDDIVVVVHLAEAGYRYYGPRFGLEENRNCFYVRSTAALEAVRRSHTRGRIFVVTTFPRALRLEYPDLASRIGQGWSVARVFPGTIGDGDLSVWTPR